MRVAIGAVAGVVLLWAYGFAIFWAGRLMGHTFGFSLDGAFVALFLTTLAAIMGGAMAWAWARAKE